MKNTTVFGLIILSLAVALSSCKENVVTPEEQPQVTLSLEDVSCTEAWIKLSTNNVSFPADVELYRDSSLAETISLSNTDSLIYVDSLLPNRTYSFHTVIHSYNHTDQVTSNQLPVNTMDTTSHNFTWQTFTFGNPTFGGSELSDVAIIDENNIWAVGEIYNDSTGIRFNAIHWDGNNWTIMRVPYYYQGQPFYNPIQTIFAFASNDIWFGGNGIIHWDGNQYNPIPIPTTVWGPHQINKIWGTSGNNLYIVGNDGKIAHYQNGNWVKIESGTTTNINDIWGINDSSAGNSLVLCTVSNRYQLGDHKLLSISGNGTTEYIPWPYTGLHGIWFNSPRKIYIVGGDACLYKNDSLKTFDAPSNYFLTRVKGNDLNDIYIATAGAEILHYNGMNWVRMSDGIYGKYEGMDVKGNTVVLVGYSIEGGIVGRAVVTIGKYY